MPSLTRWLASRFTRQKEIPWVYFPALPPSAQTMYLPTPQTIVDSTLMKGSAAMANTIIYAALEAALMAQGYELFQGERPHVIPYDPATHTLPNTGPLQQRGYDSQNKAQWWAFIISCPSRTMNPAYLVKAAINEAMEVRISPYSSSSPSWLTIQTNYPLRG